MITKLSLKSTASFTDTVEFSPNQVNYFFGSNGTGKTTISKLIASPTSFPTCLLTTQNNVELEHLVYNRDFVKENFGQSNSLKGIFTLGKDATEAKKIIEETQPKIDALNTAITGLKNTKDSKISEQTENLNTATENVWKRKVAYDEIFRPAFVGFLKKDLFFNKCGSEQSNSAQLLTLDQLKEKCSKIYNDELKEYVQIPEFAYTELSDLEKHVILSTKIIGKEDLEIGKLIKKLNNSDWVNDGLEYLDSSESKCPFCQQTVEEGLKGTIEEFFDETYAAKCKELQEYDEQYRDFINQKITLLERYISQPYEIINYSELESTLELVKEKFKNNCHTVADKIKAPSLAISVDSFSTLFKKIEEIITSYRKIITDNNNTFRNLTSETRQLNSEIWRFIVNDCSTDYLAYLTNKSNIQSAIDNLESNIKQKNQEKDEFIKTVAENESKITSVLHTKNEINKTLNLFGFSNFSLEEAAEPGSYKITRSDGSECKETLSEGEYTFITFLYFYQLLKGSQEQTGLVKDRVIVIDDPISSLDSNVLFIVSNLIKEIVADCLNGRKGIKQVFVLTHNIYFFKEVTFKGGRETKTKRETYWLVRKIENQSKIIEHSDNPIQTTYELLWRELDDLEQVNKATVHNTLRRILEYYFKIIGGIDYEKCVNNFEGEEKIICKSLVSWINDGSHFINDDLVVYVEPESIEKYLNVFKHIFEKMGHESHYKMMMKIADPVFE